VVNLVILVGWVSWVSPMPSLESNAPQPQIRLKVEAGDRVHWCRMSDEVARRAAEDAIEEGELIYVRGRIASEFLESHDREPLGEFPFVIVEDYGVLTPPSMRHDA
jgi:hypothetical protein